MHNMYEKQHCCCCVPLPEGVMLVGIYGTSFHVGLLSIQLAYNQATLIPSPISDVKDISSQYGGSVASYGEHFNPSIYDYHGNIPSRYRSAKNSLLTQTDIVDKEVVEIVYPILLFSHVLGIIVNLLLVYGVWKGKRYLMIPWLLLQGLLGILLAGLALYYLIIFPDKSNCIQYAGLNQKQAVNNQYHPHQAESVDQSSSTIEAASECSILLWYCVVMVLALFILVYYFYVVCDFVSQVYFYEDSGSYEEGAKSSMKSNGEEMTIPENMQPMDTDASIPDPHLYSDHDPTAKHITKKPSRISVGSAAKLSISSSTSKLKSTNKGRKSVHVIEIVEREPDPLYSQFEDVSQLRSDDPTFSRTQEISAFDSLASVDDIQISPIQESPAIGVQSARRDTKPFSHPFQRKNVSFVEDVKSVSSSENR